MMDTKRAIRITEGYSKMRKTIPIVRLIGHANKFLKYSENEMSDARLCMRHFISSILHETGNYKGFRYLVEKDMEKGKTFGIKYNEQLDCNGEKYTTTTYHDLSRISFYV